MKRFTACVSMVLIVAVLISVPAYAVEIVDSRGSNYFMSCSSYIDVYGTKMEMWFDVSAVGLMDELGVNSIEVQRSSDRSNWSTMRTCSSDDYSGFIDTDTADHAGYITYYGTSGYYYRIRVTYYAKKGTGSALMTDYSSSVLCG